MYIKDYPPLYADQPDRWTFDKVGEGPIVAFMVGIAVLGVTLLAVSGNAGPAVEGTEPSDAVVEMETEVVSSGAVVSNQVLSLLKRHDNGPFI